MTSKRFIASLLASALFAGLGASSALAQGANMHGIDRMQQSISTRIQQGQASGLITPSEAQVLYRREHDIQMRESQYKAKANVTHQEREQLRADLESLSAEVDRMMSNRDTVQPPVKTGNVQNIDGHEFQISQRIDEGVRSGRLSEREASRLRAQERDIERREARFKSDGVITPHERQKLFNERSALRDEVERMLRDDHSDRRDHRDHR